MSKIATKAAPKQRVKLPEPAPVQETVEAIVPAAPTCKHRWVIETPNGETSRGVCRVCGEEKEFPNSAEDGLWEREVPQSRWTGRTEWTQGY